MANVFNCQPNQACLVHSSGIFQRPLTKERWGIGFHDLKYNYGTFHYFRTYFPFEKGTLLLIEFMKDVPISLKQIEVFYDSKIDLASNQLLVHVGMGFKSLAD